MKRLKQHFDTLRAMGIYALWTLIVTHPMTAWARHSVNEFGDPLLNLWIIRWNQYALANLRRVTFFDANIFHPYGDALAYSENLTFTSILFLPLNLFVQNPILQYNLILLLSYWLTALTAYGLAREAYHLSSDTGGVGTAASSSQRWGSHAFWGAIVAGGIFAFAHYRIGQVARIQYVTAYLVPLTMLFALRFGRNQRWSDAIWLGATVGLQFWTNIYYTFFSIPLLLLFALFYGVANWRAIRPKTILQMIVAGGLALAIILPAAPAYLRAGDILGRRPLGSQSGAFLQSYFTTPANNWLLGWFWPEVLQDPLYVFFPGFICIGLLVIYARRYRKTTWLDRFWPTLALVGLVFSFGTKLQLNQTVTLLEWLPYRFIFEQVSLLSALRVPARFVVIVMLAVAVMAGQAVIVWLNRPKRHPFAALLLVLLILFEYGSTPIKMKQVHAVGDINPVYAWLHEQPPDSPYLELPAARSPDITGDLVTIERLVLQLYHSVYHWQPSILGYSGGVPLDYATTVDMTQQFPSQETLDYLLGLGTTYVVVHYDQLTAPEHHTMREGIAVLADQVELVATFDETEVYQLNPPTEPVVSVSAEITSQNRAPHLTLDLHPNGAFTFSTLRNREYTIQIDWANGETFQLVDQTPYLVPAEGLRMPIRLTPPAGVAQGSATIEIAGQQLETTLDLNEARTLDPLNGIYGTLEPSAPDAPYLLQYHLPHGDTYLAGSALRVNLDWQQIPQHRRLESYIHVIDANGNKLAQRDVAFLANGAASRHYQYLVDLPRDLPSGSYTLLTGLYERLEDQVQVNLGTITVRPPDDLLMEHSADLQLGDTIRLIGYDIVESCPDVRLTLYWQKSAETPNQTVFVHLTDANGQLLAQNDSQPRGGTYPIDRWQVGETVMDNHHIVNDQLGSSTLQLHIGMYDSITQQNLPIYQNGEPVSIDRIQIDEIDRATCVNP